MRHPLEAAQLSKLSYSKRNYIESRLRFSGFAFDKLGFFQTPATDCDGFWFFRKGKLIIATAGTASFRDIVTNARVFPVKNIVNGEHHGYIHKGWSLIRKELKKVAWDMSTNLGKIKAVSITGHSLGGIEAKIIAEELSFLTEADIKVVTFGCPKGFSKKAERHYLSRVPHTGNYQNSMDVVPKVPFFLRKNPGKIFKFPIRKYKLGHSIDNYIENIWRKNEGV